MERKLFSLFVAGLVFSAAVFGGNHSSRAALCSKCQDLMFVDSEGTCSDLRRPDRQRRPATLPEVQCQAASVRTLPGRDHGEGRGGSRKKPADPPPEKPTAPNPQPDSHSADVHRDDTSALRPGPRRARAVLPPSRMTRACPTRGSRKRPPRRSRNTPETPSPGRTNPGRQTARGVAAGEYLPTRRPAARADQSRQGGPYTWKDGGTRCRSPALGRGAKAAGAG